MKNVISNLPRADRRFKVISDEIMIGSPSTFHGIIRQLAYEKRKLDKSSYVRVLFAEAGHRNAPSGGLLIEINGNLFQFGGGVRRWPEFHDGKGHLTSKGEEALASGIPGLISTTCDWRWVQEEIDITDMCSKDQIKQILSYFEKLSTKEIPTPIFQSRNWAKRLGKEYAPLHHNCTTIILEQLRIISGIYVEANTPLPAIDALIKLNNQGNHTQLDQELNCLLSLEEEMIEKILLNLSGGISLDWNNISKGKIPIPESLSWDMFFVY